MSTPTPGNDEYDIIQIIGKKGKNIFIAKVRSKIDNKIYCMRRIKKEDYKLNFDIGELKQKLIEIKHPHIIKYYDVYNDDKYIYIIMEYIDTDIKNYIERYHITNSSIPEENIWFILLQCLSALKYIHSKKLDLAQYGIRLSNILMPTDRGIKIGIIKNTIETRKWEDDIRLLYKYFEIVMCPKRFKHGQGIMTYLSDPINNDYDVELKEIIKEMNNNPKEANIIFETTEKYYIKKYKIKDNNSIKSVFDCLSKYNKLLKILNNEENTKNKNNYLMNICNIILKMDSEQPPAIEKLRRILSLENNETNFYKDGNNIKEIEPKLVLDYILKSKEPLIMQENNKEQTKFILNISDLFSIEKQIIKTCLKCNTKYISTVKENIIIFDLNNHKRNFNILTDGFNSNNQKEIDFFCEGCSCKQKCKENLYYSKFNNFLVIYFDRENNDKTKIETELNLDVEINETQENNSKETIKFKFICSIIKDGNSFKKNDKFSSNDKIILLFYERT